MSKRDGGRKGGLPWLDPAVVEWQEKAARNRSAMTKQQQRDEKRVRLFLDVPGWLKKRMEELAQIERTSVSQLGAFFLAREVALYDIGDEELEELLGSSKCLSRALKFEFNLDVEKLRAEP